MKPYKLNLKRIIDTATRLEGKKVSISRAQMSEARRCIFAAVYQEFVIQKGMSYDGWVYEVAVQLHNEWSRFERAKKPKPARRRHK